MRAVRGFAVAAALALAAATPAGAVGPSQVQVQVDAKTVAAEMARELGSGAATAQLARWADAQNNRRLPQQELQAIEAVWRASRATDSRVKERLEGPCVGALRSVTGSFRGVASAALLDAHGAVVCATTRTERFYFGEQPEFAQAVRGSGHSVGRAVFDDGAGEYVVPVVVPVVHGGKVVGAVKLNVMSGQ
jgi:hypothetical protein